MSNDEEITLDVIMETLNELKKEVELLKAKNIDLKLTKKQKEVLEYIERSRKPKTIKEAAEEMGRSESTISNYLRGLYDAGCISRMDEVVETSPKRKARILKYFLEEEE